MKFSVLLPTKNRLDLLKYAITSVLLQDYDTWEIIVSDNCSEEDVAGYVRSLAEPRIRYIKTETSLPVTDNWNNALEASEGDYVIMLGDDDCLMPGYFRTVLKLINEYKNPDFIYTKAFQYAYPGVMPGFAGGFLQLSYASFFEDKKEAFWLAEEVARKQVSSAMDFKLTYNYNMQHSLISRVFINSLSSYGRFFQSPYPDYYANNVLFLKAKRILVYPTPIVVVGISPKSFGYYYFNDKENSGNEFLKNIPDAEMVKRVKKVILPGSNMNTSWLLSMETIRKNFEAEYNLNVNHKRYRYWQLFESFRKAPNSLSAAWSHMNCSEKLTFQIISAINKILVINSLRVRFLNLIGNFLIPYPNPDLKNRAVAYQNILGVFENIDPKNFE